MATQFQYLFSPLKIGKITVANRIYQAAHSKGFEDHVENYGLPGEREALYHAERAKGGAGLLIMGEQMVHPTSGDTGGLREVPHGYRKETVERYRMVADMVHRYETKIFAQLSHVGIQSSGYHQDDFFEVWAPSATLGLSPYGYVKAMEIEDIQDLTRGFAKVAENAREGGLDGVEIHAAHSYLLHEFLSPITNRRTDEYGGSLENRMRLIYEIIDAVRAGVGSDFVVGIRISGDDFAPGGLTLEDMKEVAKRLEATGKLDFINVSAGTQFPGPSGRVIAGTSFTAPGYMVPLVAGIKEVLDTVPVFASGRINDPILAERILTDGQADMIGMTRALIADAELPNKAREGRLDDIRHCVACMQGCLGRAAESLPVTCVQNPAAGREKRLGMGTLKPATAKKKVLVIGGGPAGLKAAEIAAERGHKVTLYEKEDELGGQVRLAAKTPIQQEFGEIARYLVYRVTKLGVKINLGKEATLETVLAEKPDVVVVATGSKPVHTQFIRRQLAEKTVPGVDQDNVVSIWDVLEETVKVGKNVVIVDDERHYRTLATADFLKSQGKNVEIFTATNSILSPRFYFTLRGELGERLRERGIKVNLSTLVKEISGSTMTVIEGSTGKERIINGVDTVVWATGAKANDELYFAVKGKVKELYRIGDSVAPRLIEFAIWEGEKVGRTL